MTQLRKYNHEDERFKILNYLSSNKSCIPALTYSKIINHFNYADSTFNRLIYWLNGAGYVDIIKVGQMNIFQITDKGILLIAKKSQQF